jgi:hypothetical protein
VGWDVSDCCLDDQSRDLRIIFSDAFEDRSQKSGVSDPPASDYLSCYLIPIDMVRGR